MLQKITGALLWVALSLFSPHARAWDFSLRGHELTLDVTNTAGYLYYFNNDHKRYDLNNPLDQAERLEKLEDDKFHQIFNKLDVSLGYGAYRAGARLDLNLFANTPFDQNCRGTARPTWCTREPSRYQDQFDAERLYLMVTRPEFDLTLGDFYVSFGKGIALSLIQLDEMGQDTTIRGGKLKIHHGSLGLTFVSGTTNVLNSDKATGYDAPWEPEPLVGGRLEYRFFDMVIAGAHAVYLIREDPDRTDSTDRMSDTIWGLGLDAPRLLGGRLSLGGEVDFQRTRDWDLGIVRGPGADGGLSGFAAYAASTLQLGDLTVLAEFKYYDDFQLIGFGEHPYVQMYHLPPTLERKKAEVKEGNTSVSGFRVRFDYNLGQLGPLELVVFASYGYFHNWQPEPALFGPPPEGDKRVHSPFGGLELSWSDNTGQLQLSAGLRRGYDHYKDELYQEDLHVEVSVEQTIGRHGLEAKYLLLDRATTRLQLDEWREMEASLTYTWSPYFLISLTYERQEDPSLVAEPVNLFGGSVRYYIKSDTYLNLRAGENRAGIKCLNGICRQMPAFSGLELIFVVRY